MRRFTRLFLDLDATTSTGEKIDLLEDHFRHAPAADAAWALALLTGQRPKRAASTRALQALVISQTGIPPWLFDECYAAVGDLSETIALLLPDRSSAPGTDEPLHETMARRVLPLINADEDERARIIRRAWEDLDAGQRFIYHKLVRGGFRVGVQRRTVARALARVADVDEKLMTQRLVASVSPTEDSYRRILSGADPSEGALIPLPFYLARPLDRAPEDLGPVTDWRAEWKYDGIRAQVVRRGGAVAIWSRGEELVTHQFPEIVTAARGLACDATIDGEILVWGADGPRPFAELQTRLNRKVAPTQPGLFDTDRLVLIAFDLIQHAGADLRERDQTARRDALAGLLGPAPDDTIRLSPLIDAPDWATLAERRAESRARGVEGLMLKHRAAVYGVGRRRADHGWWKWKVDPYQVDAVLVGAQPGSGRRANLYTDYTFALWNRNPQDDGDAALVTFAKAYSGLTQDEIETLDRWIRAHTAHKSGPFRQVEPVQVFEIAFESARASQRHKSGVAVRFPRIARWRQDKPAREADTVDAVRALVAEAGA